MRRRRIGSWALGVGAVLSAAGHGALIALAAAGPPWLRAGGGTPASVVTVALIPEEAFAAAEAERLRAASAAALPPEPAAVPPASAPPVELPSAGTGVARVEPEPEPEATEPLPSLVAPSAPETPFGVGAALTGPGKPSGMGTQPAASLAPADAAAAFRKAVIGAVRGAFEEPEEIEAPPARLSLLITRDGRLLTARFVQSSGDQARDRAAVEAARAARLPVIPQAMPEQRATVEVSLPGE